MSLTVDLNGHLKSEVVFTENYVFGEHKCNIELFLKTTKLPLLSTLFIVFQIGLQQKLEKLCHWHGMMKSIIGSFSNAIFIVSRTGDLILFWGEILRQRKTVCFFLNCSYKEQFYLALKYI